MADEEKDSFDASRADLFEALGHPNRIRILQVMKPGPLGFAALKRQVGIESSGHLTFHLGKLGGLVSLGSDGRYELTDDGKEALRIVQVAGEWNYERDHHRRPIQVRRAVLGGLLVLLIVLAAIAVVQEIRILQLTTSPVGTVKLSGRSFWEASLPLNELSNGGNITFTFHGVMFRFVPTVPSLANLANLTLSIVYKNGTATTFKNGTAVFGISFSVCLVSGNVRSQQGNATILIAFFGAAYTVTFPDGSSEHSVLSQVSSCSALADSGASKTTPWFSTHTNPQAAVGESNGMIIMYVSAGT